MVSLSASCPASHTGRLAAILCLFLLVQENLRRYVAGEPLYSVVDIERGY